MNRFDRRTRLIAVALAGVAGFVDAVAFIQLGGFFVSFMSGNSTRLGVALSDLSLNAAIAGGLIAAFVAGAAIGSLTGHAAGARRRTIVLLLVGALLTVAIVAYGQGFVAVSAAAMALAMGAENAVFEEDGEIRIGLTYTTGSLVKLGQKLAVALRGGAQWDWVPYLMHWLGLVAGAVAGALAFAALGMNALWLAVGAVSLAALVSARD
ncbi:hypothetical protein sos41_37350 [Alphaproteobacteria bacterium SO-S41]|nr:hypothetical protein sos41_37350 [Alphaproteobacteria bacterium SO-S41]